MYTYTYTYIYIVLTWIYILTGGHGSTDTGKYKKEGAYELYYKGLETVGLNDFPAMT